MDQKKTETKMVQEQWKHILNQNLSDLRGAYILKKQARSPILEDFGRSNCAIFSFKDSIILAIKEPLKKTLRFVIVNVILKLLII